MSMIFFQLLLQIVVVKFLPCRRLLQCLTKVALNDGRRSMSFCSAAAIQHFNEDVLSSQQR